MSAASVSKHAPGRSRWGRTAARFLSLLPAALLAVWGSSRPAKAIDADSAGDLNTETIARRDQLRQWDSIKKYGAERVVDRDRKFAKPDGLPTGNYLIFPYIGAAVVYDDNIFGRDIGRKGDFRSEITPGLKFESHLPRHALDLSLEGKIVNYAANPDQDYASGRARLSGALHFDSATTLSATVLTALEHQERNDISYPLTAREPVPSFHNRGSVGITRDVGRLYGTISATAENWSFSNVPDINGGTLNQSERDTLALSSEFRWGYRFSPGYEIVGKVRGVREDNRGSAAFDRDAWGFEALAGLAFETNPLLRWRILGGYGTRDYDRIGVPSLNTSLIEGEVQWLPTQRLTIYGTVAREVAEAQDLISRGVVASSLRLRGEYEIYHNLVANGALTFRSNDFVGTDRSDLQYSIGVGLDYYYTKNWLFTFGYDYEVRDSTDNSFDLHHNRFRLGAKLQF